MNSKCGVQSKRKCESHESCICILDFQACRCQKKSVVHIFFGNGVVIRHALHKSASGGSYRQIWLKCNEKMGCVGFAQALTDAC